MKFEERISSYNNETINRIIEAHEQNAIPYEGGTAAFIRGYLYTNENGFTGYAAERLPTGEDLGEFTYLLDEAGITEFILLDESTALMEILNELMHLGWMPCGGYEKRTRWHTHHGLQMKKTG